MFRRMPRTLCAAPQKQGVQRLCFGGTKEIQVFHVKRVSCETRRCVTFYPCLPVVSEPVLGSKGDRWGGALPILRVPIHVC